MDIDVSLRRELWTRYCILFDVYANLFSYFLDRLELGHMSIVKLTLQPGASSHGWNTTTSSSLTSLMKSFGSGKTRLAERSW